MNNGNGKENGLRKSVSLLHLVLSLAAMFCTLVGIIVGFAWSQSRWETIVADHLETIDKRQSQIEAFANETRARQEAVQAHLANIETHDALTNQRFELITAEHQRIIDAIKARR